MAKISMFTNYQKLTFLSLISSTETTLSKVEKSSLLLAYEVNAVGPILVIKVFRT